ncbi:MAG: sulfatase-like hydrolase/transferase [Candidatus Latescibacterota bacterium]
MAPRPNLLLLLTDQQRADALGCAGGWVRTPNLDRLAAEGVRFRNCVTNSPVCIPARLSLATGLYPHNTSVWDNQGHTLAPETPTWMKAVREAGYRTSLFGKTHLHPHSGDLRDREPLMHAYGLDDVDEIGGPRASARVLSHMTARWQELGLWDSYRGDIGDRFATKPHVARPSPLPVEEYADVYVGQRAQQYLTAYDRSEPWCCWVSFGGPHEPWDTPEPHASSYDPVDMPAPAPLPDWTREEGRPRGYLHQRLASAPDLDPGDISAMRANYAGNVTLIDEQIGGILETIEARGELDNTVIVFTSDHGELNGDFGLIYKSVFSRRRRACAAHRTNAGHGPCRWFDDGLPRRMDRRGRDAGRCRRRRPRAHAVRTLAAADGVRPESGAPARGLQRTPGRGDAARRALEGRRQQGWAALPAF